VTTSAHARRLERVGTLGAFWEELRRLARRRAALERADSASTDSAAAALSLARRRRSSELPSLLRHAGRGGVTAAAHRAGSAWRSVGRVASRSKTNVGGRTPRQPRVARPRLARLRAAAWRRVRARWPRLRRSSWQRLLTSSLTLAPRRRAAPPPARRRQTAGCARRVARDGDVLQVASHSTHQG
jgi:hypothetical protein